LNNGDSCNYYITISYQYLPMNSFLIGLWLKTSARDSAVLMFYII